MVSLVIVNYLRPQILFSCLRSLDAQTHSRFELIIVDNGSENGAAEEIRNFIGNVSKVESVRFTSLSDNKGFAGGCQAGLALSSGNYVALLNNDTEPDPSWLERLIATMDANANVGICASRLMVYGSDAIDSAGDGFSTALKGFKIAEGQKTDNGNTEDRFVFGACAGAALYRREMLDEIGFLDEDFFLIHEDTDLNFRAQLAGWKVLYVPTAVVHHKVRSSIGAMSPTAVYYSLRNSELVRMKNVPVGILLRCLPELVVGAIVEFFYFAVRHGFFRLYFKAKLDALKMLPKMLRKRKKIMALKRVSNAYLLSVITPVWERGFFRSKFRKLLRG